MTTRKTILRVQELEGRDVPASTLLGPADIYNVMVFGNFSSQNCDTQGALAVGGNVNLSAYSVGSALPSTYAGVSLVVGGNLNFTDGEVANGSVEVGGSDAASSFAIPNGKLLSGEYINWSNAKSTMESISYGMATVAQTGKVKDYYGTLTLTGNASGTNFFDLSAAELANCHGINIDVPNGSSVIINVSGSIVKMENFGINLNGASTSDVVWNFNHATSLTFYGISIPGNVLAPNASVVFNNGQINGTFVAQNSTGQSGEFHWIPPAVSPDSLMGNVETTLACGTTSPDSNITVTLSGTSNTGKNITETTTTDVAGDFDFWYVPLGTYTISITVPNGSSVTSIVGSSGGTADGQSITGVTLTSDDQAHGYLFDVT